MNLLYVGTCRDIDQDLVLLALWEAFLHWDIFLSPFLQ